MAKDLLRQKALEIAKVLFEKKAIKPVILNVRGISPVCDFFIICSVESTPQAKAVYEAVEQASKDQNFKIYHIEADTNYSWVLVDYYEIVLHIFSEEKREFYNLEHLWKEAKRVRIPLSIKGRKSK